MFFPQSGSCVLQSKISRKGNDQYNGSLRLKSPIINRVCEIRHAVILTSLLIALETNGIRIFHTDGKMFFFPPLILFFIFVIALISRDLQLCFEVEKKFSITPMKCSFICFI